MRLFSSAINLAETAVRTRRQATISGELAARLGRVLGRGRIDDAARQSTGGHGSGRSPSPRSGDYPPPDAPVQGRRPSRFSTDHPSPRRPSGCVACCANCAVIVPSAAAADQLRRTLENHHLQSKSSSDRAVWLPQILTRSGWYDAMHARLPSPPRRLSDLEREVLLNAAARDVADSDIGAPFRLRAGLLVEMLGLYDDLAPPRFLGRCVRTAADARARARCRCRSRRRTPASADAISGGVVSRLRGAARRDRSRRRVCACGRRCSRPSPARPLRHVILTVGERSVDPAGLWPADLDLLTRLPHLEQIDIVATHATIAAGLLERLEKFMPGFEEAELPPDPDETIDQLEPSRALMVPAEGRMFTVNRDREDELSSIAVALEDRRGGSDLDRRAVVFKRPLPYVYLARDVFADAGIPYQTFDALPLAAEPYAAALDLVFEFVTSNFTREPVVALLGSPHFSFRGRRRPIAAVGRCRAQSHAERRGLLRRRRSPARTSPSRGWKAARAALGLPLTSFAAAHRKRARRRVQLDALLRVPRGARSHPAGRRSAARTPSAGTECGAVGDPRFAAGA